MHRRNDAITLSASDLMRFQGCTHTTTLDLRYLNGEPLVPSEDSASGKLIQAKGNAHELAFLETLMCSRDRVHLIDKAALTFEAAVTATRSVLQIGPAWIYQAALSGGKWGGYADFLQCVPRPSKLGDFSYEVIDTKLKRSPDPKHVLQLALYSDLLADVQGVAPEHIHVVLGDNRRVSLRLADYRSYVGHLRLRLEDFMASPPPTRPEPVPACELCRWREHCTQEWDRTDSLCLLPGIRKSQRHKLEAAGAATITDLAQHTSKVSKLADETLARLRNQAQLRSARRAGGAPAFELRPLQPDKGISRLPKPARGDLFFDMEGDPLIEGGLEYLFGIYTEAKGAGQFQAFWAHDRTAEREATQQVLEFFNAHIRAHPQAHIYHYGHYELTALKRLASGHGVGEALLDQLLRQQRFVDLYRIVQQGLITSEGGASLKDLEVFYEYERPKDVATAGDSIVAYEKWRDSQDDVVLESIRAYNEADCRSTKGFRDWLAHAVRPAHLSWWKPAKFASEESERDNDTLRAEQEREQLRRQLITTTGHLAGEPAELLFELAWFHEREDKPQWWAMFDRAERDTEELIDDPDSLGGLVAIGVARPEKKSQVRTYRYPQQETKLRETSKVRMKDGLRQVTVTRLDPDACEVDVKFGKKAGAPPDRLDLIPGGPLGNEVLRDAVTRVARDALSGGGRYRALEALLAKQAPRIKGRQPAEALINGTDVVAAAVDTVRQLDSSYLPIQGPPGTGKTYLASQAILALLRAEKRVAVTSNSHKAIGNLMAAVAARAREQQVSLQAIQKLSNGELSPDPAVEVTRDNGDPRLMTYPLVAGTAWLFARPEHDQQFDYLLVDEAGQVALANIVAVGTAAQNVVLVGDPMQLSQPIQGTHPGQSGNSGLGYVLDGFATVPPELGIFLPVSRRLHPLICKYVSEVVYDGRLTSDGGAGRQTLLLEHPIPPLAPAGLRFVPVFHSGNSQSSVEEAKVLCDAYGRLLGQKFRDRDGRARQIAKADILVVTPYNAQVNLLKSLLPADARIGTVDKFQGQEAPVCLVSMATSSGEELPRDIEFLFSVNRLNVAVSRAQALCIVFASPRLLDVSCRTIEQMRLVNALCAVADYASPSSKCGWSNALAGSKTMNLDRVGPVGLAKKLSGR